MGESFICQESATFNAVSNLSPTMNKPDLTPPRADSPVHSGTRGPTQTGADAQRRSGNDDRSDGIRLKDFDPKKIWSQTAQVVREHHSQYGLHALCGLFGYTRQAYYKRLKHKKPKMLEPDIILTLSRAVRIDLPRKGDNKLRIYLRPKFEAMGISIGRDAFAALLAENQMPVHRPRSKRKNTLAERVNGILKTEWLDKRPLRNWSEAQAYVEQIIGLYCQCAQSEFEYDTGTMS